jgi:hypothetical protein
MVEFNRGTGGFTSMMLCVRFDPFFLDLCLWEASEEEKRLGRGAEYAAFGVGGTVGVLAITGPMS